MSKAIAKKETTEITVAAEGFTPDQVQLVKDTVARGATDNELKMFFYVCKHTGLDPFIKQIYFIKRKVWNAEKQAYDEVGTHQTGIDGYRVAAARTGAHMGTDDAIFEEKDGNPIKATVTVHKSMNGQTVDFAATARWSEYVQINHKTNEAMGLWKKMPFTMLAKCAESLALRKAFPDILSGVYTNEEMSQADGIPTHTADGNVKGTITQAQSNKIYAMIGENEWKKDDVDAWTTNLFGVRISGLAMEQAAIVIEALEKKAAAPKNPHIAPPQEPEAGAVQAPEPTPAATEPPSKPNFVAYANGCKSQEEASGLLQMMVMEIESQASTEMVKGILRTKGFTV